MRHKLAGELGIGVLSLFIHARCFTPRFCQVHGHSLVKSVVARIVLRVRPFVFSELGLVTERIGFMDVRSLSPYMLPVALGRDCLPVETVCSGHYLILIDFVLELLVTEVVLLEVILLAACIRWN